MEFDRRINYAAIALTSLSFGLAGCGDSQTKAWQGGFTPFPKAPASARLQTDLDRDGAIVHVTYVVWDAPSSVFENKTIMYTAMSASGFRSATFRERGGTTQPLRDGEVIEAGVVVDQVNGRLILPTGAYIDGPTGDTFTSQGVLIKALDRTP
jgi:hypothetical protein